MRSFPGMYCVQLSTKFYKNIKYIFVNFFINILYFCTWIYISAVCAIITICIDARSILYGCLDVRFVLFAVWQLHLQLLQFILMLDYAWMSGWYVCVLCFLQFDNCMCNFKIHIDVQLCMYIWLVIFAFCNIQLYMHIMYDGAYFCVHNFSL